MKKCFFIFLNVIVCLFGGCSVQEKMNSDIFFERLTLYTDELEIDEMVYEDNKVICYTDDYIFEFSVNDSDDINKISFA